MRITMRMSGRMVMMIRMMITIAMVMMFIYESFSDLGEIRVWLRADFQSGSRVLKKVF